MGENENNEVSKGEKNRLSQDYDSWLKTEFEQNFIHLRDRDDKIIGITKIYITVILSVGTVAIAILGLKDLDNPYIFVGLLILVTCIVGEILLVWLTAFRKYFVMCARQLNAIRKMYTEKMEHKDREYIVNPIDPSIPKMINLGSAHTVVMTLITFLNAFLAGVGTFGLTSYSTKAANFGRIFISVIVSIFVILINIFLIRLVLKGGEKNGQ